MARGNRATRESLVKLAKKASRASEANRRMGMDALALIRRRMQAIAEAFYDIGMALRTLAQPRVYTALGHRTFEALLQKEALMSRSSAADLIRIAERYSRQTAVDLGQAKALALAAMWTRHRPTTSPRTWLAMRRRSAASRCRRHPRRIWSGPPAWFAPGANLRPSRAPRSARRGRRRAWSSECSAVAGAASRSRLAGARAPGA